MTSRRILTEMFVSEATLEFPDGEIESVTRVLAGAARRGAIPRNASENWPILPGFAPRPQKAKEPPAVAKTKPPQSKPSTTTVTSPSPAPSSRTGRVIPATNRFRQEDPKASTPTAGASVTTKPTTKPSSASGIGTVKKAISAVRGRDPETGLPKPKSAVTKVYGGHEPATSLPRLDRIFGDGDGGDDEFPDEKTDPGYRSPFAGISGLSNEDEPEETDPGIAAVKKGFSVAKPKVGPTGDMGSKRGTTEPPETQKKSKQGRLSRLFKGRRDDDI